MFVETGEYEALAPGWLTGELAELLHDYGTRWQIVLREFADGLRLEAQARPGRLGPRLVRPDAASLREALDREESRRVRDM
jgi:hypothetical protein